MSDVNNTYGSTYNTGTTRTLVSAVFNHEKDAQSAVDWLRDRGVPESAISVLARHEGETHATNMNDDYDEAGDDAADAGKGALTGVAVGAGTGALLGLAAVTLPVVAPFMAVGALATSLGVVGGTAAAGAIVGGASGALAGALSHWGLNEAESKYYAGEVERGNTFVGVDMSQTVLTRDEVTDAFRRFNGHFSS